MYIFLFQKQFPVLVIYSCVLGLFFEIEAVLTDMYTVFHLLCGKIHLVLHAMIP